MTLATERNKFSVFTHFVSAKSTSTISLIAITFTQFRSVSHQNDLRTNTERDLLVLDSIQS